MEMSFNLSAENVFNVSRVQHNAIPKNLFFVMLSRCVMMSSCTFYMKEIVISSSDQGKTLLSYLKKRFPVSLVHKIFRKNGLRVNGIRAKEDMVLKKGDILKFFLEISDKKPASTRTPGRDFEVLHEQEDFMILNKHPGIAVHEGATVSFQSSLIAQIRAVYKPKGVNPLLVHRLDTLTSGCLIVAKNEASQHRFEEMFKIGDIQKEYLVLVDGLFRDPKGSISAPLPGRDGHLVSAYTSYEVVQDFPKAGFSLVKAQIKTGRKHQIRLHFAKIQHPVLGDTLHGNFETNKTVKKKLGVKRQFLHAHRISFSWQGKQKTFIAPLSPDLEQVLQRLRRDQ